MTDHRASRSRLRLLVLAGLVFLPVVLGAQSDRGPLRAPKTTLDEVSEKLSCRCGCNLVLNRCNHVQCGSAIPMRERINREIAEGRTKDEIIAGFVRDMGEEVLAVPPTSGFNWNAWIMPFAMLAAGGCVVILALKIMMRKRAPQSAAATPQTPSTTAVAGATADRIEQELKNFED